MVQQQVLLISIVMAANWALWQTPIATQIPLQLKAVALTLTKYVKRKVQLFVQITALLISNLLPYEISGP